MRKIISAAILAALFVLIGGQEFTLYAQPQSSDPNIVYDPGIFEGLEYRCIGPSRGGRVTAVAGIASQPSTFYMGSTGGGVWKTTDYGQSWVNVSDGYFETGSIGAIRVAGSNPEIIYVGTGSDGIRSNVITGRGVYKSTDAGRSWTFAGLRGVGQIGAVEIHPDNPGLVYVAAIGYAFGPNPDRGVYRTKDGGASWEKVLFISDITGAVDLEFCPDN
ncbi:glycosyl hydrolase, partial [bacterium SM23_31]